MSIAPLALQQWGSACELFSRTAQVFRAQPVLVSYCTNSLFLSHIFTISLRDMPVLCMFHFQLRCLHSYSQSIMTTLQEEAHCSLEEYCSGNTMLLEKQPVSQSDDELAKLGSTTRLIER